MVGIATSSEESKGRPTLYVECCTNQKESLPRAVRNIFNLIYLSNRIR